MTGAMLDRLRDAQVATLYRSVAPGVLAAGIAAAMLASSLVFIGAVPPLRGGIWAAFVCACAAAHLVLRHRRTKASGAERGWRRWANRFVAVALAEGLAWGWATVALAAPEGYEPQLLIMLVAYGIAGGSLPAFGSYLPAFWCIFFPITVPFAVRSIVEGRRDHVGFAILSVVYIVGMAAVARRTHAEADDALRLRLEVDELAAELGRQKDLAEAANLAKSRFLAAASHDLRQPVHALSLSVGALQALPMPDAARTTVGHIEASVEALDRLFTALLDISRLDAAVVTPHVQVFALQPLLERVVRDHRPEAEAKGVALRLRPTALAVRTDPLLLERILRNLVSNAVRYTATGGVLVGCRPGTGVRIQVWDTGRGIPPGLAEKVFEEFFQVGNPERDSAAGLGLGLAIVRRLTRLLDLPLSMQSIEGRGSVFSVDVPRAAMPPSAASVMPRLPPGHAADGAAALILIIDDEPTIQAAMQRLLEVWGYGVIAAGSCEEMLLHVADESRRPDLVICDYRLRDGEDGIATIRRLQSEYNDELPAILVTGDTGPERLVEARASGIELLHKPVEHNDLRRLIDRLLRPVLMS